MITFRPTNLEDFEECLEVNQDFVDKYFEQGDVVRILQGTYKCETGIITEVHSNIKFKEDEE